MIEPSEIPTEATVPAGQPAPPEAVPAQPAAGASPAPEPSTPPHNASDGSSAAALASERPELAVGVAFAGGFLFAMLLKRLAR